MQIEQDQAEGKEYRERFLPGQVKMDPDHQ
jgi:hypothetical protein